MADGYEVPNSAIQKENDSGNYYSAQPGDLFQDEKFADDDGYEHIDPYERIDCYDQIDPENMRISNNLMEAAQHAMGLDEIIPAPPKSPPPDIKPREQFTHIAVRSRVMRYKWTIIFVIALLIILPRYAFLVFLDEEFDKLCVNVGKCCVLWAKQGQCLKNSEFMESSCRASCDVCTAQHELVDECGDCHIKCAEWAKSGECSKNRRWMSENCRTSCQLCPSVDGDKFWNARSGIQMYPHIVNAFARSGHLVVSSSADKVKYSLYLWSLGDEENPRLLAICKDAFPPAVRNAFVIIPNSTMVSYSPAKINSTIALFDIKTCKTTSEMDIGKEIMWTDASTEELTLATQQEVLIYSLRRNGSSFISSIYTDFPYLSVSDNRILVYRDANRTINVYDMKEQTILFTIEDGGTAHDFQITPNGEFLAINTKGSVIVMYEVSTHNVLFSQHVPRGTTLSAISADGRCFAQTAATTMICTLVCFFEPTSGNDTLIVDSGTDREMTHFAWAIADSNEAAMHSMTFRSINDTLHFQYVTIDMGVLKLFKINENERNWDLLTL